MKIIEGLLDIGFSEYEASVYAALVSGNKLSASEICNLSGVPQGRVYSILSSLMDMGMCFMIPGTVKRYQALPPSETFAQLYDKKRSKHEAEEKKAMKLSQYLSHLYETDNGDENDSDSVSIYTSMASIVKKSNEIIDKTKETHRSFCKPPYAMFQDIADVEEKSGPILEAMNSGVEFRSIYELEEDDMDNFIKICQFFHEKGEKVKIMEKLPIKLIVMDSRAVMFTMYHKSVKKNQFTSMYIENADIVIALTELFEYYWSIATSFTDFVENGYKLNQ